MSATLIAFALLGLTRPSLDVTVDSSPGDVISGIHEFHVRVGDSKGLVTQVEFYLNHDLKDTVSSIPYNFKLDTVSEDEGPIEVEFRAYTTEGETGKKSLSLKIDNDLGKGADYHVDKANALLTDSKWDDAILEARIALKAKSGYNPARLALAMAYKGKGAYDRAQKYAEDAVSTDPTDNKAKLLLSAINVDRAFATFSHGDNSADTQTAIRSALKAAIDSLKKMQDDELDAIKPSSDNITQYADKAIRAGRFSLAVSALTTEVNKDSSRPELANRLAYALMREGKIGDALTALNVLKRYGKYNAYSYALEAVLDSAFSDQDASDEAIKEAMFNDGSNLGVVTAEIFLAMQRNKTDVMAKLLDSVSQKYSHRTEVMIYMSALLDRQGLYGQARDYFIEAVKSDPMNADAYIQEGNVALQLGFYGHLGPDAKPTQAAAAQTMFYTALEARPESAEALTGLSISSLVLNDVDGALKFAKAATVASRSYAAGYYALSAACKANHDLDGAAAAVAQAGKLDKRHLEGSFAPTAELAWRYFAVEGRTPLITAPEQ